jgi:predicted ATPase
VSATNRFVVISGCSGGGKSSLIAELVRRGYSAVEEPGRRIVQEELQRGGSALPWVDSRAFLDRVYALALADHAAAADLEGWVFFDRGLVDAAAGLERLSGEPTSKRLGSSPLYHRRVFLTPPWPDIHVLDHERRHTLNDALIEYEHLTQVYTALGYDVTILPKVDVRARADLVLRSLTLGGHV